MYICLYIEREFYKVFGKFYKVFEFYVESWPEWDSNSLPRLQDQVTTKLKSSLGDCSGRVRITFAANFLYFLYFHPRS